MTNNITCLTINSFSSGLLWATKSAKAIKALSFILISPSLFIRYLFLSRNQTNIKAPILLFPSENGWDLIIK